MILEERERGGGGGGSESIHGRKSEKASRKGLCWKFELARRERELTCLPKGVGGFLFSLFSICFLSFFFFFEGKVECQLIGGMNQIRATKFSFLL